MVGALAPRGAHTALSECEHDRPRVGKSAHRGVGVRIDQLFKPEERLSGRRDAFGPASRLITRPGKCRTGAESSGAGLYRSSSRSSSRRCSRPSPTCPRSCIAFGGGRGKAAGVATRWMKVVLTNRSPWGPARWTGAQQQPGIAVGSTVTLPNRGTSHDFAEVRGLPGGPAKWVTMSFPVSSTSSASGERRPGKECRCGSGVAFVDLEAPSCDRPGKPCCLRVNRIAVRDLRRGRLSVGNLRHGQGRCGSDDSHDERATGTGETVHSRDQLRLIGERLELFAPRRAGRA